MTLIAYLEGLIASIDNRMTISTFMNNKWTKIIWELQAFSMEYRELEHPDKLRDIMKVLIGVGASQLIILWHEMDMMESRI